MKFSIKKSIFIKALSFACEPILSGSGDNLPDYVKNLKINVTADKISFSGTNLDILFVYSINKGESCNIETSGKCLLYIKTLLTILKKFKGDDFVDCYIVQNENIEQQSKFVVKYKNSIQELPCYLKFEYPADSLKINKVVNAVKYPAKNFIESYNKVMFACGQNFYRFDLRNLCIEFVDEKVFFVGTSGQNIAIHESNCKMIDQPNNQILLRKDAIPTDKKVYDQENDIAFSFGFNKKDNKVIYITHNTTDGLIEIFARPIDKKYPEWQKFHAMKKNGVKFISFDKKEFIDVIDRIAIVSPLVVCLYVNEDNKICFSGASGDKLNCDIYEYLDGTSYIKNKIVYINTLMLREGIKNISGDNIEINIIENENSVLLDISGDEDKDFIYMLNTIKQGESEEQND